MRSDHTGPRDQQQIPECYLRIQELPCLNGKGDFYVQNRSYRADTILLPYSNSDYHCPWLVEISFPGVPKMKSHKKLLIGLAIAATGMCILACIALGGLFLISPSVYNAMLTNSSLAIGEQAPDFELETLTGETLTLSQFRGQPVLLSLAQPGARIAVSKRPCCSSCTSDRRAWLSWRSTATKMLRPSRNMPTNSGSLSQSPWTWTEASTMPTACGRYRPICSSTRMGLSGRAGDRARDRRKFGGDAGECGYHAMTITSTHGQSSLCQFPWLAEG